MLTREIVAADAADISALSEQLGYKMTVEKTAVQIRAINNSTNDSAYVAIDNDKVVGWIHVFYTIRLECEPYCEIGGIVIHEQYRGKGVGKMLVEHLRSWCLEKRCTTLRVRCNIKRNEAHEFYRHLGFIETTQQRIFDLKL